MLGKAVEYEYHTFSGEPAVLVLAQGTERVVVLGRHSDSVQEGGGETRALKENGWALMDRVRPYYIDLLKLLTRVLLNTGSDAFCAVASRAVRSILTTGGVLHPPGIEVLDELAPFATSKLADPDGDPRGWRAVREGAGETKRRLIYELGTSESCLGFRAVEEYLTRAKLIIETGVRGESVVAGFAHEDGLSLLAARNGVQEEVLGLRHCESFVFCVDNQHTIIHVERFSPFRGNA